MRVALPIVLSMTIPACTSGPPEAVDTAIASVPPNFALMVNDEANAEVAALLPQNDPAYVILTTEALSQAPSIAQAVARIEQARAGVAVAGAERLPTVDFQSSLTATRINPDQFGVTFPPEVQIDTERAVFGANLTARWEPDLFGRLRNRVAGASARLDAATADAGAVRNTLLAELAASVIDWRTLAARQSALEADLASAQSLTQLAGTRERAGIAPEFDRVRAEGAIAASRSRIAALESERAWVIGRLVTLTGVPTQEVLAVLRQPATMQDPPSVPTAVPSTLLTRRPDVLAAAANLAAADADLAVVAARRFPQFNLSAAFGLLAFDTAGLFASESVVGTAGAGLLAPLIDFGRIAAEIDGAAATKHLAFAAYRDAVFSALGDAETAYGLIAATDRELAAAISEANTAERAGRLASARYRAGLSDFLTVLEARRAADASGERVAVARGRTQRARVLLWRALGGHRSAKGQPNIDSVRPPAPSLRQMPQHTEQTPVASRPILDEAFGR